MRPRRFRRSIIPFVVAAAIASACTGTDAPSTPQGSVIVNETASDIEVRSCALRSGAIREQVPVDTTETVLTADGVTQDGQPVSVTIRRSRSGSSPHRVESADITIGDPDRHLQALVLYRAYDEDADAWTEIDADAPSGRVRVSDPLLTIDGAQIIAAGTVARADGERVAASITATCPADLDDRSGLALPAR